MVKYEILFQKTMKLQICQKNVQKRVCDKIVNFDSSMSGEPKFQNSALLKENGKNFYGNLMSAETTLRSLCNQALQTA